MHVACTGRSERLWTKPGDIVDVAHQATFEDLAKEMLM